MLIKKQKKAGGGKEPRHDPNGDPRPHYHPNVKNSQRSTPNEPCTMTTIIIQNNYVISK